VVIQVDAMNLLEVINRGSPRLPLNFLARDLFWFCLAKKKRFIGRVGSP
jgi:hypothetical protein